MLLFSPISSVRFSRADRRPLNSPVRAEERLRGFTLLESLTVIAVIALLTGMVIGVGHRAGQVGRTARAKAELASLATALENYQRLCGDYPQTDDEARLLQSLIGKRGPQNATIFARSFLEITRFTSAETKDPFVDASAVLLDPWGRAYVYAYKSQSPWANPSYLLYSPGPDGLDAAELLSGGFFNPASPANADNLVANRN